MCMYTYSAQASMFHGGFHSQFLRLGSLRSSFVFMSTMSANSMQNLRSLGDFIHSFDHSVSSISPHVYIGNEAGDADSIISSLCYGYLQYCSSETLESSAVAHIPLLSISRGDLKLRPEVQTLFNLSELSQTISNISNSLYYYDDIVLQPEGADTLLASLAAKPNFEVTLLDHNAIAPKLTTHIPKLNYSVTSIIDHHLDQGMYIDLVQPANRNIAFSVVGEERRPLVGSTCTLVAEAFLARSEELGTQLLTKEVATLLAGVILIDTMNMDEAANRGTDRDESMLQRLLPFVKPSRIDLYETLMRAKFDPIWWESLTTPQILNYDYKQSEVHSRKYGISSALLPLESLVTRQDFSQYCLDFMEERQLETFAVMTLFSKDADAEACSNDKERQLMLCARSLPLLEELLSSMLSLPGTDSLQLKCLELPSTQGLHAASFSQGDMSKSRKQVMPLFHTANEMLK